MGDAIGNISNVGLSGHSLGKKHAGLIIREQDPVNLEFPFDQLDSFLTPNDLFYVRSHFTRPVLEQADYRLTVDGAVEEPFSLNYGQLQELPAVTRPATLECAGNGRVYLVPQVRGAQWQLGAVSTAEWTGVPLSTVLDRARVTANACEIVLQGADQGTPKEEPIPPTKIHYALGFPLIKAKDVVLAYAMNGQELGKDHGYPVRAVVPGYYGMASVKWLTHIHVVEMPFQGYFQISDYAYWDFEAGNPVRRPIREMLVKSAIARPTTREVIEAGSEYRVSGAAWSGAAAVSQVEVSTDGGHEWKPARFIDGEKPFVWRRWEFEWKVPSRKGRYILMSRATDKDGNVQPDQHDRSFGTYVIHHTLPVEIEVQ